EAELRRLDRDLRLQPARGYEHLLVVGDHLIGVFEVGDVLAEQREQGADALSFEVGCRLERGVKTLAGKKTSDRTPREAPPRHVGGEPGVPGAPQEKPSHQASSD